jgi:hypothetical protein
MLPEVTDTQKNIIKVCDALKEFLLEKNRRYGDSALHPLKVFSKLDAENGIRIRLDDKLKRIQNSEELRKNDCIDIQGYLVLFCVDKGWTNFSDLLD